MSVHYFFSNNSKKKTKKKLTKDIFHWLELINKILSFLQIFSVRKTITHFRNSARISTKKNYISDIF